MSTKNTIEDSLQRGLFFEINCDKPYPAIHKLSHTYKYDGQYIHLDRGMKIDSDKLNCYVLDLREVAKERAAERSEHKKDPVAEGAIIFSVLFLLVAISAIISAIGVK